MAENEEKKFLHDIASTVTTAIFVLEMALENMKERAEAHPSDLAQVSQTFELLGRIRKSIEERRRVLIQGGGRHAS